MFSSLQTLTNHGVITVDGEDGISDYRSGGGSGGTIRIQAASLVGRGTITSHGGEGQTLSLNSVQVGKFHKPASK